MGFMPGNPSEMLGVTKDGIAQGISGTGGLEDSMVNVFAGIQTYTILRWGNRPGNLSSCSIPCNF